MYSLYKHTEYKEILSVAFISFFVNIQYMLILSGTLNETSTWKF